MNVTATALPRKSASATGLPSCEVRVKGGAGPMTGSCISPPASRAASHVGNASSASASRHLTGIISRADADFAGILGGQSEGTTPSPPLLSADNRRDFYF